MIRPAKRLIAIVVVIAMGVIGADTTASAASCEYWVAPAPTGHDSHSGSKASPWATLTHAAAAIPDRGCTVWFEPGVYSGAQKIERRFDSPATFRAASPYRAAFRGSGTVVEVSGAANVVIEGFDVAHTGSGSSGYVMIVDRGNGKTSTKVTIRNNVIHDSWDNDLLKVHDGSSVVTIEGNVFYNQGASEQHLDINSVSDIVIQDNILFNDYAASNRSRPETKHFIIIKDSNEGDDGLIGSRRITVRRNQFLNWQGAEEQFVKVGNDGKAYHEAREVWIDTNLFVGNSPVVIGSPFGVAGARDVYFLNNTVVGDLPSKAFAVRLEQKGSNPRNENIHLHNNIWSDPTGTMGEDEPGDTGQFSSGDSGSTTGLSMSNNLYWNGGRSLPDGDVVSPTADRSRLVTDPLLPSKRSTTLPYWNGSAFASGNRTIAQEFSRLALEFGVPSSAAAVGARADTAWAGPTDLLNRDRGPNPSLGALEPVHRGRFADDDLSIFEADIEWLAGEGITTGCNPPSNTRFCPDRTVTRGQMAAFLRRALDGVVPVTSGTVDFRDDNDSVFEADIEWLAATGITTGCGNPADRTFCPDRPVTRAQMSAFLHRALGG